MSQPGPPRGPGRRRPDLALELVLGVLLLAGFAAFVVLHVVDVHRDLAISAARWSTRRSFHLGRHPWLHDAVDTVENVGAVHVVTTVGGLAALALAWRREWTRAAVVFAVGYAAAYTVAMGKLLLRHPVDADAYGMPIGTFPSGHTADVTAVLGVLLVVFLPVRRRGVAYVVAALVGAFVAFARVVIGAHTRDDVAASWLLAVGLVVLAGRFLARREQLEVRAGD